MIYHLAGEYEVLETIAERDGVIVQRCRDLAADRDVAVKKAMRKCAKHANPTERIRREIIVRSAVSHPGVLPLCHAGQHNGNLFAVGPWLEGGSLAHRTRGGKLPASLLLLTVEAIADALAAVHAAGWTHGDVKLENIVMRRDSEPVLIDFTAARPIGTRWRSSGELAEMTEFIVAPEVRDDVPIAPSADVYSLGVLVYRSLTGHWPLVRNNVLTPPSTLSTAIGQNTDDAVSRALAAQPELRYESAPALARALRTAMQKDGLVASASTHAAEGSVSPSQAGGHSRERSRGAHRNVGETVRAFERTLTGREQAALAVILARALGFRAEARSRLADVTAPIFGLPTALLALEATKVAAAIALGKDTLEDLETSCGVPRNRIQRLLEVVTDSGLVRRSPGERYALDPALAMFYQDAADLGTSSTPLADAASFWQHAIPWAVSGEPVARMDRPDGATYAPLVNAMGSASASIAIELATELRDKKLLPEGARILDIGAGSAVWSLACAIADDACRITAVDREAVLEVTRANARTAGVEERLQTVSGDWRTLDVRDAAFDAVILANICHLEAEEAAQQLVARSARALRPSGALIIIDAIPDDRGAEPLRVRLQHLRQALRTGGGAMHDWPAYERWLGAAGVDCVRRMRVRDATKEFTVLVGRPRQTSLSLTASRGAGEPECAI
jgi:SAM-dependent methyltransferase